jgi:AcrR family transcriptional regulator
MQMTQAPHLADRGPKGVRTREQIFQAALAEFRRVGVEAASIGQIAAQAGTSRASFYFHYPCKEAVLLDLQWRLETEIVERMRMRATLREALDELFDGLVAAEANSTHGELLRDVMSVYVRRPAGVDLTQQAFPLSAEVSRRFAAAQPRELRAGLDAELATHLFLCSLFGLLVSPRGPLAQRRDEMEQLASLFLEAPARGRRRG